MNCKSGDLAVIVESRVDTNVGGLVRVIGIDQWCEPGVWCVEALSRLTDLWGMRCNPGHIGYAEDSKLRPIRDPGDDAKDETLSWKPVPSTKEPKREILALPVREM